MLTWLGPTGSYLVLPKGLRGSFLVQRLPGGVPVAEVNKVQGNRLRIALTPGRYRVRKVVRPHELVGTVVIRRSRETALSETDMVLRPLDPSRAKGGPDALRMTHVLTVGYEVQLGYLVSAGLGHGLQLGYAWRLGPMDVGLFFGYVGGRYHRPDGLAIQLHEASALGSVQWRYRKWRRIQPFVAVDAGGSWVWQRAENPTGDVQWASDPVFRYRGRLGALIRVAGPAWVSLWAHVGQVVLRRAGRMGAPLSAGGGAAAVFTFRVPVCGGRRVQGVHANKEMTLMKNYVTLPLLGALALALVACGGPLDDFNDNNTNNTNDQADAGVDAASNPDAGDATDVATLYIYVEADLTEKTFTDGLSGQTPKNYTMALARFDVMTSASDTSPVTIFDHGNAPRDVDMLGRTLAGTARMSSLPAGTYSHGRVKLVSASFDVDATVHAMGNHMPGTISVFAALSDHNDGTKDWTQGQAEYTFSLYPTPMAAVIPALPSTVGGQVVQEDGETWLVFEFDQPMTLSPDITQDINATMVFEVFESFRWEDQDLTDYTDGVLDTTAVSSEPVLNFGATGYAFRYE